MTEKSIMEATVAPPLERAVAGTFFHFRVFRESSAFGSFACVKKHSVGCEEIETRELSSLQGEVAVGGTAPRAPSAVHSLLGVPQ